MTTQKVKIWKRSHGSPITIFSLYVSVYKHLYRDFTKDEKEHQDSCIVTETSVLNQIFWLVNWTTVAKPVVHGVPQGSVFLAPCCSLSILMSCPIAASKHEITGLCLNVSQHYPMSDQRSKPGPNASQSAGHKLFQPKLSLQSQHHGLAVSTSI